MFVTGTVAVAVLLFVAAGLDSESIDSSSLEAFLSEISNERNFDELDLEIWHPESESTFNLWCESGTTSLVYDCSAEQVGELLTLAHAIKGFFRDQRRFQGKIIRELQLQSEFASGILVPLQPDGTFRALLPVGEYVVSVSNCDFLGCSSSLPVTVVIRDGETSELRIDIDTGIRSTAQPQTTFTQLADDLRNAGAEVKTGSDINQPFFRVPGRVLTVNGSDIQVFEFSSMDDAQTEVAKVGPDGYSIGTSMVDWVASPHFYAKGSLIVLYVGDGRELQILLEGVVGNQFAGGVSVTPSQEEVSIEADMTARRELSGRLGAAPGDLRLVRAQATEHGNGGLGCPDAGMFYTEAIVPGYVLLYELNGLRYPFHVSTDGRFFTDCRRENNVAAPFRLADDIVKVKYAFQLAGGTPSHLGEEVELRTLADAQAFLSEAGELVAMDLEQIDWDTEMLVGTVITGSGCGFEAWVPLVFMQHLSRTVDINVAATQTGLCEKAWAQPVWLIVQEVPKDYSASFILSYRIE